jgi:hypothetical protein
MAHSKNEQGGCSGRRLRGTNLLAQCIGDVLRGYWTELGKVQAEIVSVHPPNRCSFNFYRRAIVCKRNAQRQIEAWLNRVVALDTHSRLG